MNDRYHTPSICPKALHYWESKFIKRSFWGDWLMMRFTIEQAFLKNIKKYNKCRNKKAHQILWNDFVEATCGDENALTWEASGDFIRALDDYDLAYYLMHLYIGSDINDGFTETEAIQRYKAWLGVKADNGNYGKFRVTQNLEIVPVKVSRRKRRK